MAAGVDFFESSYPFQMALKNFALNYNLEYKSNASNSEDFLKALDKAKQAKMIDMTDKKLVKSHETVLANGVEYTFSYLHHMLDVKEMNATILITLHNCN